MAEPNLESMVNAPNAQGEHKEAPKPKVQTPLEEIIGGIGGIARLGLATAIPWSFGNMFPTLRTDTAILSGAQVLGDWTTDWKKGKRYTAGNALESSIIGTMMAPALAGAFNAVHQIPLDSAAGYIGQAAAWGGIVYPTYFALYQGVTYLVRNKTFKGMGKYIKENYWPALKRGYKTLFPFSVINLLFAPAYLNIPIAAALTYGLTLFGAPKKEGVTEENKRIPGQYYKTIPSVTAKAAKTATYGVWQVFNKIGDRIADLTYNSAKPAAPSPAPQAPAAAHP